jgi:Domain of unknown function (DUF4287)
MPETAKAQRSTDGAPCSSKQQRNQFQCGCIANVLTAGIFEALDLHQEPKVTIELKVKGPASYFPSIETAYGQPIIHWLEIVNILKAKHKMGHGHSNAVVAYALAKK